MALFSVGVNSSTRAANEHVQSVRATASTGPTQNRAAADYGTASSLAGTPHLGPRRVGPASSAMSVGKNRRKVQLGAGGYGPVESELGAGFQMFGDENLKGLNASHTIATCDDAHKGALHSILQLDVRVRKSHNTSGRRETRQCDAPLLPGSFRGRLPANPLRAGLGDRARDQHRRRVRRHVNVAPAQGKHLTNARTGAHHDPHRVFQ